MARDRRASVFSCSSGTSRSSTPGHAEKRINENEKIKTPGSKVDETSQNIRVCLRFRPMNKLETSRRSHNCVEVHPPGIYGSTELTVDSPLEGEYNFNFDQVFEGDASQSAVYEHAGAPLAKELVEGRNCALIVYGQSGSGKTYTMMGNPHSENESKLDTDQLESRNFPVISDQEIKDKTQKSMEEDLGIIPRITKDIFEEMEKSSASVEFTVRVSYIEIYLEQIRDLLNPSNEYLKIIDSTNENMHIRNLSELCCIDKDDVVSLLDRGHAYRRISEQKNKTDLKQAHSIFMLKIEQRDTITRNEIMSRLYLVDMAGSESEGKGLKKASNQNKPGSAVYQLETKIINRAHSALGNVLRALSDNKQKPDSTNSTQRASIPKRVPYKESKLTTILKDALGGNCLTALILGASPASYNISATIATMRLGQKCRRIKNSPKINLISNPEELNAELADKEKQINELSGLIGTVVTECQRLKAKTVVKPSSDEVLDSLGEIFSKHHHLFGKDGIISNNNENDLKKVRHSSLRHDLLRKGEEIASLTKQLDETKKARDRVHNLMLEIQAECAILRTENDAVLAAKKRNTFDLIDSQNEIQDLCQQRLEAEHNLRTSQFRETEATVFLRHFRRFYKNILKNQATKGSGSITDVTIQIPGVPDMKDVAGIDHFLAASGLIEMEEVDNDDNSESYSPSIPALLRSSASARKALYVESELLKISKEQTQLSKKNELERNDNAVNSCDTKSTSSSVVTGSTYGATTAESKTASSGRSIDPSTSASDKLKTSKNLTARQMRLHTPAGIATKIRQEQLEDDLSKMSRICIELQIALNEEREYNELLSIQEGAKLKKQIADEGVSLKRDLSEKSHDLQAVIWKMNELHLINKTYDEKLSSREQHVLHLEESLAALNQRCVEVAALHRESEKKSRKEIARMQSLLSTMTKPIWQYGETGGNRSLESRIMIPIQGGNRDIVDDTLSEQNELHEIINSLPRPESGPGQRQGQSLDVSNTSSLRTSTSVDIRAGIGTPPTVHVSHVGLNLYSSKTDDSETDISFAQGLNMHSATDTSEAGLSYSSYVSNHGLDFKYGELLRGDESDSKDDDLNSNSSGSVTVRAGMTDGGIALVPLVEEMTLTSGNASDDRSVESRLMRENVGNVKKTPPDPIPFGGHTNDFIPRRFNKKFGTLVMAGVLKPSNRLHAERQNDNYPRNRSRESIASSFSSREKIEFSSAK